MQKSQKPPNNQEMLVTRIQQLTPVKISGKLRPLLPAIDDQIRAGVPRQKIIDTLKASGLDISLRYLDNAIYRWRKRQRKPSRATAAGHGISPVAHAAHVTEAPHAPPPTTVQNRADLARLRHEAPDLDMLALLSKSSKRSSK